LRWLSVEGFRNLDAQRVDLSAPTTLLYGLNAQGKTNVLEAIYLLGTTRSFRDNRLRNLVKEGCETAQLEGEVENLGVSHRLSLSLSPKSKQYRKDGAATPLTAYLPHLPVVVLSSEDGGLVSGVPRHRRDFLDATSVWRRPAYLDTLLSFGRTRIQRNEVLRTFTPRRAPELDAWTKNFLEGAEKIRRERLQTSLLINQQLGELGRSLQVKERLSVAYRPSGGENLADTLRRHREEEIRRGVGLVGPQRDGLEIILDGKPIQAHGSSGQIRTALWLLKLARVQLLSERDSQPPVFLLDDVEVELDQVRIGQMMNLTRGKAQLVMTATRPLKVDWAKMSRFRVEAGRIMAEGQVRG
jgi:DNA replication and repair protein RecF